MRAAIFEGNGRVNVTATDDPLIHDAHDVIVRVVANGIGSDLHALKVPPVSSHAGVVIGHEMAGVVAQVGSASPFSPGDRVVVHPNLYCDMCHYCSIGRPQRVREHRPPGQYHRWGRCGFLSCPVQSGLRDPRRAAV